MPSSITLVAPGLFAPALSRWVDLGDVAAAFSAPGLDTLVARARETFDDRGDGSIDAAILCESGWERPADSGWPVAPCTRIADGGMPDRRWWIRLDPVHIRPGAADAVLIDADGAGLTAEESPQLAAEVAAAIEPLGMVFEARHPHRWYASMAVPPDLATTPLPVVRGRDVSAALPSGRDAPAWHRLMNEVQISLHASPVNRARDDAGASMVNSVWPWGGGTVPEPVPPAPRCWGDHECVRGVAGAAARGSAPEPAGPAAWDADAGAEDVHVVVLTDLAAPVERGDVGGWLAAMSALDERWFAPLVSMLRAGRIARIRLVDEGGVGLENTRTQLRRWWRRRGYLAFLRSRGSGR